MPDFVQPLSEALIAPPVYVLHPHLQPEILEGEGNLPRWSADQLGPKYGLVLTALFIPPHLGRQTAAPFKYHDVLVELTLYAPLFNGFEVIVQQLPTQLETVCFTFSVHLISRVQFAVLAGCQFTWSYLQLV